MRISDLAGDYPGPTAGGLGGSAITSGLGANREYGALDVAPMYYTRPGMASTFLRGWFKKLGPDELIELRGFDPPKQEFYEGVIETERAIDGRQFLQGVYYGVNPRRRVSTGRPRGSADAISSLIGLFADIDLKPDHVGRYENAKRLAIDHVKAQVSNITPGMELCIVDSGHGLHVLLQFALPIPATSESLARFALAQKNFGDAVDGDRNARDAARVLRLPGSVNMKRDPHRMCLLIENPSAWHDNRRNG